MGGVTDHGIYWHSITTSLFQGGSMALGLAVLARLTSPRVWRFRGMDVRLASGTLVVLLAVWNLVFGLLAGITGLWATWGFSTVTSITLTMNKAMFGSFALLALILMLWLRYRYGPVLWDDMAVRTSYAGLGFIVAGVAVVSGSLGGEASLLGTVLAPVWEFVGIVPRYPMVLPTMGGIVLVVLAAVAMGVSAAFGLARHRVR